MSLLYWELIGEGEWRAKVPNGWLVKTIMNVIDTYSVTQHARRETGWEWRASIAFVPDHEHRWGTETTPYTCSLGHVMTPGRPCPTCVPGSVL